jgi:DNA-binding CsgD family transcriptional regulator
MEQFVILLYILALASGAMMAGRLASGYRKSGDRSDRLYIGFFASYTFMVLGVGVLVYVRVNTARSFDLERLATGIIMLSTGIVARLNAAWNLSTRRLPWNASLRFLTAGSLVSSVLSAACVWIVKNDVLGIAAIVLNMTFFTAAIVVMLIRLYRHDHAGTAGVTVRIWGRVVAPFIAFSLAMVAVEVLLLRRTTLQAGWFLSMPLVYLGCNVLTLVYGTRLSMRLTDEAMEAFAAPFGLTPKEYEVTKLIAEGKTNHEISYALGMARNTVKNHISSIYRKAGVSGRVNLVNALGRSGERTSPGGD